MWLYLELCKNAFWIPSLPDHVQRLSRFLGHRLRHQDLEVILDLGCL